MPKDLRKVCYIVCGTICMVVGGIYDIFWLSVIGLLMIFCE